MACSHHIAFIFGQRLQHETSMILIENQRYMMESNREFHSLVQHIALSSNLLEDGAPRLTNRPSPSMSSKAIDKYQKQIEIADHGKENLPGDDNNQDNSQGGGEVQGQLNSILAVAIPDSEDETGDSRASTSAGPIIRRDIGTSESPAKRFARYDAAPQNKQKKQKKK